MFDCSLEFTKICIWCDNTGAINLSKNPIQHSRSNHIDIKHHFIKDHVQKGNVKLKFIETKLQVVDIITKTLIEDKFKFFKSLVNVKCLTDL